jgi:alpha-L-fucosidase
MLNVEEIENGLVLPGIPRRIVSSALLTGGDVRVEQTADAVTVHVPEQYRDPLDTIVKLTLDRSAMTIPPVIIACESLAAGKPATASSVLEPTEKHVPGNAFDENPHSHWVTAPGTKQAVVEVDLQKPYRLGRAVIQETYPGRIKNFRLEYKQGDQWKAIVHGQYIGRERRIEFPPVEARYVRLNILEAAHPPAIQELKLFER